MAPLSLVASCVQVGSCLYLNGDGAYVDMAPPDYSQSFPNQMSLSVWFKHEVRQSGSSWTRLFECNNGEYQDMFVINQYGSSTRITFEARGSQYHLDGGFPTGVWVHLAWTLQKLDAGGNTKWRIFKDGAYHGSRFGGYPAPTHTCYIGKSAGPNETPFKGRIDTFAFYPHILTSEDVQLVYQSTGPVVRESQPIFFN
jgi:hypothetical protein